MADYTINHNIFEGRGSQKNIGSSSKSSGLDGVKLAKDIGKVMEKVSKDANKSLASEISKQLDNSIRKVLISQRPLGAPSKEPISKSNINNIIKNVSLDTANSILKEMSKGSRTDRPGHTGNAEAVFKNMDKQISAAIGKLNTSLSSQTGVDIGPAGAKIIGDSIGVAIRSVISKEIGQTLQATTKSYQSIQRSTKATTDAISAISKLKKSGGGVDITEIPKVIKSLITLRKEAKELSNDYKDLKKSVKTLTKDQENIMSELGAAVKELKSSMSAKFKSVKDIPKKLIDEDKFSKAFDDFLKKFERISKEVSSEYKISPVAPKEITQLNNTLTTATKKIDNLGKKIDKVSKDTKSTTSITKVTNKPTISTTQVTVKSDTNNKSDFVELVKLFGKVMKDSLLEQKKVTGQVQSGTRDVADLQNLVTDRDKIVKAIKELKPTEIKELSGRGVQGVDQKITDNIRTLINGIQKLINKPPADFNEIFSTEINKIFKSSDKTSKALESIGKVSGQTAKVQTPKIKSAQPLVDTSLFIKDLDLLNSKLRGPFSSKIYPEAAIPATKEGFNLPFEGTFGKGQEKQKQLIQARIDGLSSSLFDLQDYIVNTLDEEFAKAGGRWSIVRDGTEKGIQDFFKVLSGANMKESGKQHAFQIANVDSIKKQLFLKGRGAATKGTSASMVKELTDVRSSELANSVSSPANFTDKIAKWLKNVTVEQIKQVEEIKRFQGGLVTIKKGDISGVLPSENLIKQLNEVLGKDRATLEQVFKATAGRTEATRSLKEDKLVRTVSIPAARLTKTGGSVFETSKGSKRALQRFATFKTGFEQLYEDLANQQALSYEKGFADKIKEVGVKPTGLRLDKAKDLAEQILTDYANVNEDNLKKVKEHIFKASQVKYLSLGTEGGDKFLSKINESLKTNEIDKSVDNLISGIKAAGLSTYDVVKSMDKIDFINVYDILQKVLKGAEGGIEPLKGLGQKPQFDKFIRDYENSINQVVQSLPLIEPGRPRREMQQEGVLNVLSRTSDIYSKERDLKPEDQKDFIKELNIRFNEIVREASITNEKLLQEGIRTISTLGVPESTASKVESYRPGSSDPGTKFLGALDAMSTKMYTDIIPELAPFGAQFTQVGRNVAGVTNALSSSKSELDRLSQEFKATVFEGFGTEFPGLRTERESGLISSGRLGAKGYGFNALTELRHTSGTMEDQILVSGNLAKALTSITKTLVRPSPGGRVQGGLDTAIGISELQSGVVKDKDIVNVLDKIQEVLGVPEQYKGRADQAFIDDIRKAITVVRGEEVEVQQARITEVFLNSFGRKFSSRYGSKGVSVTPTGLGKEQIGKVGELLKAFPKAKVKVLTEEERGKAGLGVAVMPRSMGELFSEVIDKYQKQLESEGFDVTTLKKMLSASGNKFVLEMFKDAEKAIVVPEEATEQRGVFQKASGAFKSITGEDLSGNREAIQQITNLFKKEVGGETQKEKAIDIRISSVGIGKRGLQPEVLEAVMGNITSVGESGFTTLPTKFSQEQYERLLGGSGKMGELSKVSKSLGFETAGSPDEIKRLAEQLGKNIAKGNTEEDILNNKKIIAERAAALEAMSNYYTTIIDEFGEKRKSIVGEKFLSIVQETGETEPWRKEDIRRGKKGASVDIPVFSAYSSVFGENSKLMDEISGSTNANQRKQLEFLKALQFMADDTGVLQDRQSQYLGKVSLNSLKYFDQSTGIMGEMASELDPRSLKDTVFDIKKFPKPFLVDIPKSGADAGETESLYVPGALARGTYSEELVGGERGVEHIGRRLQHVVNMAKKATELLDRPATIKGEIEQLEEELQKLISAGDPRSAQVETKLLSRRSAETKLLSGEGEVSNTVTSRVTDTISKWLQETQKLRYDQSPNANKRVKEIYSTISNALSKVEQPEEAFKVKQGVNIRSDASEFTNVDAFLKRQLDKKSETQAFADAIGKASDLLIGKGPKAQDIYNTVLKGIAELQQGKVDNISMFKDILSNDPSFKEQVTDDSGNILNLLQEKQRYMQNEMQSTEDRLFRLAKDIQSGKGMELAAKLGIDVDKELQFKYEKALDNLQKAKIDYFHSLAESAVGKTGAIGTAIFSRKFPAVMKKATNAIVDRTEEFSRFKETLTQIKSSLPEEAVSSIDKVISDVGDISTKHSKRIAIQRKGGFPVLKQHELGIPEITAKKLPVKFEKELEFTDEGAFTKTSEIDGTLYDLLKYRQQVEKLIGSGGELEKIAEDELENTAAFVEAIRYPFTGVSSIVPYEAKLLEGSEGQRAKNSFVVPGAPELDVGRLDTALSPIEDIIVGLSEQREELFKQSDITGEPVDTNKIKELTHLMDTLAGALTEVIPKYAAHTAKLDFDGDEIAVHTARTRGAREEIAAHHKSIMQYDKSLQSVYRNIFSADALSSQKPTGDLILAEQAEAFYKKFPKEKGFDYLVKPFLTGQAVAGEKTPTLEYASPTEKLSILGLSESSGIAKALEGVILDTVEGVGEYGINKEVIVEALQKVASPFEDVSSEMASVKSTGGIEKRLEFADDLYKAIEDLDNSLGTSFVSEIQNAVTSRVFESKYKDAVEAQLFKIHTGIETEALYRLNRLVESNVGFGSGFVGSGAASKQSKGFSNRNPDLKILGGDSQAVADDFFAKFHEVFRFALQKGMDVKHAGGQTIAGVIERNIAGGGGGISGLWESIIDTNDETFSELRDFSDVIDKTSKVRLGEIPTIDIRKQLEQVYEARGTDYSPAELAVSDRKKIIDLAVKATGLRSFFEEMSVQVKEAAIDGIITQISQMSPDKRSQIGDKSTYAKDLISSEISQGGINVSKHIIEPKLPLYGFRKKVDLRDQERKFKGRYGEVNVPENIKFLRKDPNEAKDILDKYMQAKATAKNIQDAMIDASKGHGGGAYAKLVKSSLDNIHRDQSNIEKKFKKLNAEGFDISKVDRSLEYLSERVIEGTDIPNITKDILSKGPENQARELERLADLVGVPTLTREEKLDVSEKLLKDFRKHSERIESSKPNISEEEISTNADKQAKKLAEKAVVVYEMDRIIDVLGTRAQEGITLLSLFPESGDLPKISARKTEKSYKFSDQMKNVAQHGQAMRDQIKDAYGQGGTGSGGFGTPSTIGGSLPMSGGIVPVSIQHIKEGIGVMFGSGQVPRGGKVTEEPLNPVFEAHKQNLDRLSNIRGKVDQHGDPAFERIQDELKGLNITAGDFDRHETKFTDDKFQKLQKEFFPGIDPSDYEQLKEQFFTTTMDVFSGSKFKGGGDSVHAVMQEVKDPKGQRKASQIEGISNLILNYEEGSDLKTKLNKRTKGKKLDDATQAAFDLGTALHMKVQKKISDDFESAGRSAEVEIEKFVFLDPSKFVEGVKGPITGFIDVVYKDTEGKIEKITDIKTTGESFAKFETLSKFIPDQTIELDELLNKKLPGHIRQKLEEYKTQLNVYLFALKQRSEDISIPEGERPKVSSALQAEISFRPSEDTELTTTPLTITFKPDESRLKSDIDSLHTARNIISDYIHNLDVELKDVPEEHRDLVAKLRKEVSGKSPGASKSRTLDSYLLEQELDKIYGVTEQGDAFINEYVELSKKAFDFMEGKEGVYTETKRNFSKAESKAKAAGQAMEDGPDIPEIDPSQFAKYNEKIDPSSEQRTIPKGSVASIAGLAPGTVGGYTGALKKQFQAIQELHDGSIALQTELSNLDFNTDIEVMHKDIKDALAKGKSPPKGQDFSRIIDDLVKGDYINFQESMKAWKLWRIAMGDFLIQQAKEAEQEFDTALQKGPATREFSNFKKSVGDLAGEKGFITRGLGKRTDIYTKDRRFLLPERAEKAGVFESSQQLFEKQRLPFGEDEFTRGVYKDLLDKLESGTLGAPAEEISKIVDQLGNLDEKALEVLRDAELFKRMGKDATEAWDFEKVAKRARVLREALSQYAKFNLSDEFQTDVEKKFQVRSLLQYLKQIEQVYGKIDMGRLQKGPLGEYETGAVKVPSFLSPGHQQALHRRNIQKFGEFSERTESEGGPQVGESFSYFAKVTDQAGNVLKNVRVDFKKYGEILDETGQLVGKFSETQKDLVASMQMSGGTFRSAAKRVIMWGAAASLVYGGVQALKDSIGELADIETGLAQLRMVMNPLDTDFKSLQKSAIGFAKSYGVGVRDVLAGMKIFAQQGLKQSEVVDRTRVSTLAANVTTLSAGDATEALTAAMKSFGSELGSADMALDAWSETEARHAITAADMANAIKKAAAAAKNAGFTFNELNGIVAGIGAVTRQTGKEVGTAMRFIARRIFSEKGPKSLGEIGIPTVIGSGENRRGFDILSDLSMKWGELTNAQKLNISQSLGGTRQYNALLVAMDNWDEVLEAIEDSTNSKGSAERRNVEIMKTYTKQLEQTKAAASELKLELGKFIFPVFKTGLKGIKLLLEFMSAIPTPVKAAGVALGLFFTYAAKGLSIFDGIQETFSKGSSVVGNFVKLIKGELGKANFEIFGKGFGPQLDGLKTFAKGAPDALKASGVNELHSGFGKLIFVIKDVGDSYNKFLAATGGKTEVVGDNIAKFGKDIKDTADKIDKITDVFQLAGAPVAPWLAIGVGAAESFVKGFGWTIEKSGELFGDIGRKAAETFSDVDPGLFKSVAPLILTVGTAFLAIKKMAGGLNRARQSAQEYAQSVYNARRIEEDQIKALTNSVRQYDRLEKRLQKIDKVLKTPGLKRKQQESDNYSAPILALSGVREDATKLANELAIVNNKLVVGYDEQGNAILRLTGNYKTYIESLQKSNSLELAKTDIDILKKYTEALTDTGFGESIKRVLSIALGEIPGFGGLLKDIVSVSPGKEMEVMVDKINDLLNLREEYPLSNVFDQDISKLQDALGKVKKVYDETASDFKKTLAGIFKFEGASTIDRDTIARLLSDPELKKGFDLLVKIDPRIEEVNRVRRSKIGTDIKERSIEFGTQSSTPFEAGTEDVIGSEILKRIFPKKKAFIDYTAELTAARAESAGILAREGNKVASGDIVTFFPDLAKELDIAGAQAVVELKETTDGVYEAFITYIDSKTLKVEERALDDPFLTSMVDQIFPSGKIQTELEYRLDALNTFVAGAASGLVGIDPKKFKKDFDLGARFYSEIPTTTVLQADKGFNFQTGKFGEMPKLQQEFAEISKTHFLEPMAKYNLEIQQLSKNTLDGLGDSAIISRQKADELYDQQAILRNNQVIVQLAAVFADLSKTMEESRRVLSENLIVERARQNVVKVSTGLMEGVPEGFDSIDLGVRRIQDLSVKQIAARSSPEYRKYAGDFKIQQIKRESAIGEMESLEKTKVAIRTIMETQGGLGSIVGPEAGPKSVEGFIQKAVAMKDIGMATLSNDINNLDTTSSEGFGNVVDRLETMIANQGDFTTIEEQFVKISKGTDKLRKSAVPSRLLNKGSDEAYGRVIAEEIHKLANKRSMFTNKGDQASAAAMTSYIDMYVDELVGLRGVTGGVEDLNAKRFTSNLFGGRKFEALSQEEFQQRAFRRMQPDELIEKFKSEGAGYGRTNLLSLPQMPTSEFKSSDEYKQLVSLQKEANALRKKSLIDSKTILKGSAALIVFESYNKKHSSAVLDKLNAQLVTEEKSLAEARVTGQGDIPEMEKGILSLKEAISGQQDNLKFHSLVAALSKITGTTTALSKVFGISESKLKLMNVGALGLYLSMKTASEVTGKDLPESVKEFGVVSEQAIKELLSSGDLKTITAVKFKAAGSKFEEAYGERVKEATGKTRESINAQIDKRFGGMKSLSEREITAKAGKLREEASSGNNEEMKAFILAMAASTFAGTAAELSGNDSYNAELENIAQKTSEVFNDMIEKWPEAADLIAQEMILEVKKQTEKLSKTAKDSKSGPENQLANTASGAGKSLDLLNQKLKNIIESATKAAKKSEKIAKMMYNIEIIAGAKKSLSDFIRTLSEGSIDLDISRKFEGVSVLNKTLSGSPGDVELPLLPDQMSSQQRLFSNMGNNFKTAITDYSDGINLVSKLSVRAGELEKKKAEFIENNIEDPQVWEVLNREVSATYDSLESATDTVREFGTALSNLSTYDDAIANLKKTFNDVVASQAVETIPGFQKYKDNMDKLLGGSNPEAVIGVTPEQERMGRGVGMQLRHGVSNKYDLERAQLLNQRRTASGQESLRINQRLVDLPEAQRRDMESYNQKAQDTRLRQQQAPYEQTLVEIEKLRQNKNITDKVDNALNEYQKSIVNMLEKSSMKMSRSDLAKEVIEAAKKGTITFSQANAELKNISESGAQQRRGTLLTETSGIAKKSSEIYEALRAELPTREISDLKVGTLPIVDELKYQTEILKAMSKEDNVDDVERPLDKPFSTDESEKKPHFFARFHKWLTGLDESKKLPEKADVSASMQTVNEWLIQPNQKADVSVPMQTVNKWLGQSNQKTDEERIFGMPRMATGGKVFGAGGPKEDKVPAMLSPGEFVIKQPSAAKLGSSSLEYLNKHGEIPTMNEGGYLDTAFDFYKNLSKNFTSKRMKLVDDQTSHMLGYNKVGKSHSTLKNLAGQTGLVLADVASKSMQEIIALAGLAEYGVSAISNSISEKGILGTAKDFGIGAFNISSKIIKYNEGVIADALSGELGGRIHDFIHGDALNDSVGNLKEQMQAGVRDGTIFTALSAGTLTAIANNGARGVVQGSKLYKKMAVAAKSKKALRKTDVEKKLIKKTDIEDLKGGLRNERLGKMIEGTKQIATKSSRKPDVANLTTENASVAGVTRAAGHKLTTEEVVERNTKWILEEFNRNREEFKTLAKHVSPKIDLSNATGRKFMFSSNHDPATSIAKGQKYKIKVTREVLEDPNLNEELVAGALSHDFFGHGTVRLVRDEMYKLVAAGKKVPKGLKDRDDFARSFSAQGPMSDYAKKFLTKDNLHKYPHENFSEFVRRSRSGEITGPLVDEYKRIFQSFSEGGSSGGIMQWLKTAKEFYFGKSKKPEKKGMGYLDSKKSKYDLLDSLDPEEYASGGKVFGAGGPKEDKVPAMLSPGEFVIKQASAAKLGTDSLEHINKYGEVPGMAEGGIMQWLKTAKEFYFGKSKKSKKPEKTGMGYLDSKKSKYDLLDSLDPEEYAEGGVVDSVMDDLKKWLSEVKELYFDRSAGSGKAPTKLGGMGYLSSKKTKTNILDPLDAEKYNEGGEVDRITQWFKSYKKEDDPFAFLNTARDKFPKSDFTKITPLDSPSKVEENHLAFLNDPFSFLTKPNYVDYGESFESDIAKITSLDLASKYSAKPPSTPISVLSSKFEVKPPATLTSLPNDLGEPRIPYEYVPGPGESDGLEKSRIPYEYIPDPGELETTRKALFAEETASKTGRRFGKEVTALHRKKQGLSQEDIMAAKISKLQREIIKLKENDPEVRELLRFKGLRGDEIEKGLLNITYDERTGLVGDTSLGKKYQSYDDLRDLKYLKLKQAIADGKVNKPTVISGLTATAGSDPKNKAILDKDISDKKDLRAKIFDIKPGDKLFKEAGLRYGRETELLLPIYHKLKKLSSAKGALPGITDQFKQVSDLLGKDSISGKKDIALLDGFIKADKKGTFTLSVSDSRAKLSKNIEEAFKNAKSIKDLEKIQKMIELLGIDPEQAAELAKNSGMDASNLPVSKVKKRGFFDYIMSGHGGMEKLGASVASGLFPSTKSAGDTAQENIKKELEKFTQRADGGSIPFFQSGGVVSQSGPIFAHKGEVVVPKGFAEGGMVENSSATAALREGTIKLEDNGLADKIAEKIKEAIETSEIKVDDSAVVKVDVTDVSIPVDVGDAKVGVDANNVTVGIDSGQTKVPVDVSSAADAIGDAITQALANATVDVNVNSTGENSVGADRMDELSRTVKSIDDRLLETKDNLEIKIESVKTEVVGTVKIEISSQVESAMTRVQQDINEHRNTLSHVNSKINGFEYQMDHRIREVDRLARDAQNLAQRPPTNVPLI